MSYDEEELMGGAMLSDDDNDTDVGADIDEPIEPLESPEGMGFEDDEDPDNRFH